MTQCKQKYIQKNPGKIVYHCKYNYHHIFLDDTEHQLHLTICDDLPAKIQAKNKENIKYWQEFRENQKEFAVENDETNPFNQEEEIKLDQIEKESTQ